MIDPLTILLGSLISGGISELTGGDFGKGALMGAAGGAVAPVLGGLVGGGVSAAAPTAASIGSGAATDALVQSAVNSGAIGGALGSGAFNLGSQAVTPVMQEAGKQAFAQSMKDWASNTMSQMVSGTGSGMAMNALTPQQSRMTPPDTGMLNQQQQQIAQLAQQNIAKRQALPTAYDMMLEKRAQLANPYGQSRGMMA
jgi:hypothetical protein